MVYLRTLRKLTDIQLKLAHGEITKKYNEKTKKKDRYVQKKR